MSLIRTHLVRISLCAVALLMMVATDHGQTLPAANSDNAVVELPMSTITSGKQPRLRRLHLVRPDLIPYPLQSEFVC